uniref:Putative capsid protein n=1 Tax=Leptosphaeria biglobosa quadrivirus 1 TaxID=2750649 RepID=A0A7D8VT91_9VIRU|nr:putative capsid protein [Leptosphaeria biglobosa quadrivirus 1]
MTKADNDLAEVTAMDASARVADTESKSKILRSDLVSDSFDGNYGATRVFQACNDVLKHFSIDYVANSFESAPTINITQCVNDSAKDSDNLGTSTVTNDTSFDIPLAIGVNPNAHELNIASSNDLLSGVAHVVINHTQSTDHDQHGFESTVWNYIYKDAASREMRKAGEYNLPEGDRHASFRDNVDPTGFVFSILMKLVLHSSAVREDLSDGRKVIKDELPSDANTMLSWPIAAEFDKVTNQVRGFHVQTGTVTNLISPVVLSMAASFLTTTNHPVVRITITDNPHSVSYTTHRDETDVTLAGQQLVHEGAVGQRTSVYYLRKKAGGRIWLSTPITTLFAVPTAATSESGAAPVSGRVEYFTSHLQHHQQEVKFLLARTRMQNATGLGPMAFLEQLDKASFHRNQSLRIYFSEHNPDTKFILYKRELAQAALILLRGYGVRMPAYNRAAMRVSELMGATYFMGSRTGGVASPAHEQTLPPIQTFGIQALRAMNAFGGTDPQSIGLGQNFSLTPVLLGMTVSLSASLWNTSVERMNMVLNIGKYTDLRAVTNASKLTDYVAALSAEMDVDAYGAVGTNEWRPSMAAASYMLTVDKERVADLARIVARNGSVAAKWQAKLRTAMGLDCTDGMIPDVNNSLGDHARTMNLTYSNGAAYREWHSLPQNIVRTHVTGEGIAEAVHVIQPQEDERVAIFETFEFGAIVHAKPAELMHRNLLLADDVGTYEQLLLAATNERSTEMRSLTADIDAKRSNNDKAIDLAIATTMPAFTGDITLQLVREFEGVGPTRYVIRGDVPALAALSLARSTNGYLLAPTDSTPSSSAIATAPDAIRIAARAGNIAIQYRVNVSFSTLVHVQEQVREFKYSPQSSVQFELSARKALYLSNYSPMDPIGGIRGLSLYSSAMHIPSSRYITDARDSNGGRIDDSDFAALDNKFEPSELTEPEAHRGNINRYSMLNVALHAPTTAETTRQMAETFGRKQIDRQAKNGEADKEKTQIKYKTILVPMTTPMELLAEVISRGIRATDAATIRSWIAEAMKKSKQGTVVQVTRALTEIASRQQSDVITFDTLCADASAMGLADRALIANPQTMAYFLLTHAKPDKQVLRRMLLDTEAGWALKAAQEAAAYAFSEISAIHDTRALLAPVLSWLNCTDTIMQEMALSVYSNIIAARVEEEEVTVFEYVFDDSGTADTPTEIMTVIDLVNEKAHASAQYGRGATKLYLKKDISWEALLYLPVLKCGTIVLAVTQVLELEGFVPVELNEQRRLYKQAFALNQQFWESGKVDGVQRLREALANGTRNTAADVSCITYDAATDIGKAVRLVASTHLYYAGSAWTPRLIDIDYEEVCDEYYDSMQAWLNENFFGNGKPYSLTNTHVKQLQEWKKE